MSLVQAEAACDAYTSLAPHYDAFTAGYPHHRWLVGIERLARRHGLSGTRVLDVGCGTGKSLQPLLELGYDGVGCDRSPPMLAVARERLPDVAFHHADLLALTDLGRFSWVIAINDTLNHVLGDDDLRLALASLASVLEPGGLLTFDLNTELGHRRAFNATWVVDHAPERVMCWRGAGVDVGGVGTSEVTVFVREHRGWRRVVTRHAQRRWMDADVVAAAAAAGLEVVGRYGQTSGAVLHRAVDWRRHHKVVYVLRRPDGEA